LVDKKVIGVAFGLIGCVRNLGTTLMTMSAGVILDNSNGYFSVFFYF